MLRLFCGMFGASLRVELERGRKTLLRSIVLVSVSAAGVVLLLASALLGLSAWLGSIAATGLLGLTLLLAAALGAAVVRRRPDRQTLTVYSSAPADMRPDLLLPGIGLTLGFVLARTLRRKIIRVRRD
jgi:hypothetical protein